MIILVSKKTVVSAAAALILAVILVSGAFARLSLPRGRNDIDGVIWAVNTQEKAVALTFDDGPDPEYTSVILDILKKNGVKATFFTVGERVERFPKTSRAIVESGNEIANHTYSHPSLEQIKPKILTMELEKAHQAIVNTTNTEPALFRPPGGVYNDTIIDTAREKGYQVVMWSWTQDTRDWANPGTNMIVKKVVGNIANGDIIIFHDCGGNRSQTVNALQPIITALKAKGFDMITVSELLEKGEIVHQMTGTPLFE